MVTSNSRKQLVPLWLGEQRAGVGGAWNLDVWRRLGWSPLRRGSYPLGLGSRHLEVPSPQRPPLVELRLRPLRRGHPPVDV